MAKKQILGTLILSGYFLSRILSIFGHFQRDVVEAFGRPTATAPTKLIAVLVDEKINAKGIPGLERYTTQYLPQKYGNSKAVVLSLNTQEYSPFEIQKLLENLYFEGEKDQASELIGVILVGDIPLPVVQYNEFLFPSIYPYVDFLDQKYLWNEEENYFVKDKNSGQAEIWHGMLNFKSDFGAYGKFFEKLKKYHENPNDFIEKKIRYDDFIALQNNFLEENYKLHTNKIVFSEDLAYNRYNDLLVNTLQEENENQKAELIEGLPTDGAIPADYDPSKTKTPTKFLQEKLKALTKEYSATLSFPLKRTINENIQAAGRREKAENHYQKLELKDALNIGNSEMQGILREINDKLENFIDQKIKQEKYAMNAVIPTFFANEKKYKKRIFLIKRLLPDFNNAFQFFYFGKNANLLEKAQDASIYRGTFRNLESFGNYSTIIQDPENPAKSQEDKTDLKNKSLGASYDVFSQQTEGNRGFNMLNTPAEYELYNKEKTHKEVKYHCTRRRFGLKRSRVPCSRVERKPVGKCNPNAKKIEYNKETGKHEVQPDYDEMADCENFAEFGNRVWGGATPLSATGIANNNYHFEGNYDPKSAWKWIFDIAGSVKTKKAEPKAHSFQALTHYLSPTQTSRKEGPIKDPIYHDLNNPLSSLGDLKVVLPPEVSKTIGAKSQYPVESDYFKVPLEGKGFFKDGYKKFKIIKIKTHDTDEYREYRFKTIDTTVQHKSSTADEINGRKGKKYDMQAESYQYFQQLSKAIQIKEDKFSGPLLEQIKKGENKVNEILQKIQNLPNAPEENTLTEQEISDFSALFDGQKENFQKFLEIINEDYGLEFSNQIEIIKNQQIEKEPKIGLLAERYQKISEEIKKGETQYTKLNPQAESVFNSYKKLYEQAEKIQEAIKNKKEKLEEELNDPTLTPEQQNDIQNNLRKREELKTKITQIQENIDKLNQASKCESYHENLGGLLGKSQNDIKNTGSQLAECNKENEGGNEAQPQINLLEQRKKDFLEAKQSFEKFFFSDAENPEITIPGMSITTPDRPIDSPRYTSFQGIGGNEIKLIYPNLFKVEAFELSGDFLTIKKNTLEKPEFKKAIENYLKNKVAEYNAILAKEKSKAKPMNQHYEKLKSIDPLATPLLDSSLRPYKPFTYEEFLTAIGGEKMLNTLAQLLYYQNLSVEARKTSDDILEDLNFTKKAINLNRKIAYLTKNYLTQENDKFIKKEWEAIDDLIIPTYANSGYEVGVINSNFNDIIITETPDILKENTKNETEIHTQTSNTDSESEGGNNDETEKECGFDYNESLLLLGPRFEGLKCWLKETIKKPAELKLIRPEYKLWETMGIFEDHNAEKATTQPSLIAENIEIDKIAGTIIEDLQINNPRKIPLEITDEKQKAKMQFQAFRPEAEELIINIKSTGNNCLLINKTDTCNAIGTIRLSPQKTGAELLLETTKKTAGTFNARFEICDKNKTKCGLKNYIFSTVPGQIKNLEIKLGEHNKIAAGVYTLIEVNAFDQFRNKIHYSLDPYILKVDQGGFLIGGHLQKAIEITDFKNTTIIYQAPIGFDGNANFQIYKKQFGEKEELTSKNTAKILPAKLEVLYQGKATKSLTHTLNDQDIRISIGEKTKINEKRVLKFDIFLKDKNNQPLAIDVKAQVQIKNKLLQPMLLEGEAQLKNSTSLKIEKGKAQLYLLPTNVAGDEEVKIIIPGLDPYLIKIKVLAGPLHTLALKVDEKLKSEGETVVGKISFTDQRGNLLRQLNTDWSYSITTPEEKKYFEFGVINGKGEISHKMKKQDHTVIIDIPFSRNNKTFSAQETIKLRENFLDAAVQSGLNIMYLNYFGNDRGNQRGYLSRNSGYGEEIIKKSDKTLAITTQLVDLKKVKKPAVLLTAENIENRGNHEIFAKITDKNQLFLEIPSIGKFQIQDPILESITLSGEHQNIQASLKKRDKASIIIYDIDENFAYSKRKLYAKTNLTTPLASWSDGLQLAITEEKILNTPVREVLWNGKTIAKALLTKINFTKVKAELENRNYSFEPAFYKGSTHQQARGLFDQLASLQNEYQGYDSIQNSDEMEKFIGFRGNFKNISSFAAGMSVGEATVPFGSEFLINLGDPALTRKDKNKNIEKADYNGGLGTTVYSNPDRNIFKVKDIDYNSDGLLDIIVVDKNGTISLQKQNPDHTFQNLEDLMISNEEIEDIYIGDIDGNKDQDIIIKNKKNQIRAYLNTKGEFDVDGRIACLNTNSSQNQLSQHPETQNLYQFFVEDMNRDGAIDMITYDLHGDVKIFYGNGGRNNHSYLSKETTKCDPDRYKRQKNNINLITNLGIQIKPQNIKDRSLIRRAGLQAPNAEQLKKQAIENTFFPSSSLTTTPLNHLEAIDQNFNPQNLANTAVKITEKYLINPFEKAVILDGLPQTEQAYIPIDQLEKNSDPVEVSKIYRDLNGGSLLPNEDLQITVQIKANKKIQKAAFFDRLQGPREIKLDKEGKPENFKFLRGKATFNPQIGDAFYYLSDIDLEAGELLTWNYTVRYPGNSKNPPNKIEVLDENILDYQYKPKIIKIVEKDGMDSDDLPDIGILPTNACVKSKTVAFNRRDRNKKVYQLKNINLQELVDAHNEDVEKDKNEARDKINQQIQNVQSGGIESIPGLDSVKEKVPLKTFLKNVRKEGLKNGNFDLGQILNLEDLLGEQLNELENNIQNMAKAICNGFSLGSKKKNCKGLPVPFNQAFLAPGNYHIMGCFPVEPLTQTIGKGIPVFHFPGTLPTPIGPIPFPRGFKGTGDDFLRLPGGEFPSMIRIYAAPTLTAQLGLAICLGPQSIASKIPSPLADLGGNCIVTSMERPLKRPFKCEEESTKSEEAAEQELRTQKYKDLGSCQNTSNIFPFPTDEAPLIKTHENQKAPSYQEISIPSIRIGGVQNSNNTILGGNNKGIKKIVGEFLYNQIEYFKNNLLRRHINLYLPNFEKLNTEIGTLITAFKNIKNIKFEGNTANLDKNPFTNKIGKEQIQNFGFTEDGNPFLQLKKLFNESELIKISTQNIPINIPRIYGEEIEAYSNYLRTRRQTQGEIFKTRKDEVSAIIGSCPAKIVKLKAENKKEELNKTLQECQKAETIAQKLISVESKFTKLQNQIFQNIETLQLYKKFPFEVYEWLHITDKYMAEVAGVINNFFGYLNFWLDINASRLSQYVDAITTILAVVKSYQILIDITANRSSKCGTCTNDTYDQYTCKLSFLCGGIKIDPIPIPKIKIPSLNIDLSHLDASLHIILPNFQFNPKSIELPRLPNIPLPPKVGLNIDRDFNLPDLPQLPEPPPLPELPSIIPQVKLKLPILPPAPKIPELPSSISGTLKIIEKIGKIYCIIKQGFGLVGEKSVKAKIEQITQRTYDVPRVDHLNLMGEVQLRLSKNNLQGLDYGIESHAQLQYNFDRFYAFLKGITNEINKITDTTMAFADDASNTLTNTTQKVANSIENPINGSQEYLNVDIKADLTYETKNALKKQFNTERKNQNKTDLALQIQKALPQLHTPHEEQKFQNILSLLQQNTKVEKNQSKLNSIKTQITSLFEEKQSKNLKLAQLAKQDYKEFLLALVPHNQSNKNLQLTYNADLFKSNTSLEHILQTNNITDLYIQAHEQQIDGYLNALEKHSPDQLNMSPNIHLKNKNYLKTIKKEIHKYQLVKNSKKSGSTALLTKNGEAENKLLYAQYSPNYIQEMENAQKATPPPATTESPDYSHYVKGVFVKTTDKKSLINVVNSEHNYEKYLHHYQKDMNKDGKTDLILRDQNNIYIKYANDNIPKQSGGSGKYYHIKLNLKNKTKKYEKAGGSRFKVYDEAPEVKNFTLKGQNFDTLSFSRNNNPHTNPKGYLMRIATHIENHPYKQNADLEKYALFLPKDTPLTGFTLQIGEKKQEINTRIKNEILYPVKRYNPEKEVLDLGLSEIPRKWQYAQITSLELEDKNYKKNAPRSNQELGGRQIIADTEPPVPSIKLLRPKKNNQIRDQGNQLEGRVGTYYDLEIDRKDNLQVEQVSLKQGEKTLIEATIGKPQGTIRLPNLFFTKEQDLEYLIEGNDSEGNSVQERISLKIKVPKIEISDITRLSGRAEGIKNPVQITSTIEQEIDQGTVTFERKRNEIIKEITAKEKGKEVKHFATTTDQTQITGAYYDFGDLIGLYNKENQQYGTLNAENGELKINQKFADKIQISVHFAKHYPILQINENGEKRFDIILKTKELLKSTALQGHFVPLQGKQFGSFDGGQALMIDGKTMLFISKTGALSTNQTDLIADYRFNPQNESVIFTIKEHRFGKAIAEIEFKTLSL